MFFLGERRFVIIQRPSETPYRLPLMNRLTATSKRVAKWLLMRSASGRKVVFDRETRRILQASQRKDARLAWQPVASAPSRRYDASGAQIQERLYLIGGYSDLQHVNPFVDVLDLKRCRWVERFDMSPAMAHHHHGIATDGDRFVYCVSGQFGPRCSPAIPRSVVLDVTTRQWSELPPLPDPRYAPALQWWRGRLHVLGGAKPDRVTPAFEHWSLAIDGAIPLEPSWRREHPIPRGGGHRSSAVVDDRLYLLGGQEGDFKAIPGQPDFTCTHETQETVYPDSYVLEPGSDTWQRLPDMPVPVSHTESSVVVVNRTILLVGGYTFKDPHTYRMELTNVVQRYDPQTQSWTIVGALPYRIKTTVAAYHDGWLYAMTGQRDHGDDDPTPGAIDARAWRAPYLA